MARRIEDLKTIGGHRLLRPSTYTRDNYRQTHRSGGQTPKHRDTGKYTRGSMAPAASQLRADGGRQPALLGGATTKRKTEKEEARGGERYARAGKVAVDMELGRGDLGGGREGGDHSHHWNIVHNPN